MKRLAYAVLVLCATNTIALTAQTYSILLSFNNKDGAEPYAGLLQGTSGDFYGTTQGGSGGAGTVFKITPSGTLTTLYTFCSKPGTCPDGAQPQAGLVQGTNGDFYGTTYGGGAHSSGTVFKITANGTLTTLHSFAGYPTEGAYPFAGLIQGTNGNFYGTTSEGGANSGGTIFQITPGGALTTLHSFCVQSGCPDGINPYAGLIQATNGAFYGTTNGGGANARGTVFEATASGTLTTLYSFCSQSGCADGVFPRAALVQAINGDLYGTTAEGGVFEGSNYGGTVFKITPGGTLTTLYSFCAQSACMDGDYPDTALVQGTDGNFYGATNYGGAGAFGGTQGGGTLFQITPSGALTTLYNFCSQSGCTDGDYAQTMIQSTNGTFYGTTLAGGVKGDGTVFSLPLGLGPFVEAQPASGRVGTAVRILGTNLTGAASVTFKGVAAVFTVVSRSEITTNVPAGATTGTVQVVTPGATLLSNVPFRVP